MTNTGVHAGIGGYVGYRGLPPLVGLMDMERAATRGLSVEESVERLKRHHWMLKRLHEIFVFRLTAMPIYELKMAFSLHLHLCAEHIGAIQSRVREMREPPLGLEQAPCAGLDEVFDEIKFAREPEALLLGLYEAALPTLIEATRGHLEATNRLFDHPTHRICRLMLLELDEIAEYGRRAIECLVDESARALHAEWTRMLRGMLVAAADASGATPPPAFIPRYSRQPFAFDPVPGRDERFQDLYNQGVNAEAFLHDPEIAPLPKTLMLYFKRMREIDVPEMMASIIAQTPDKPWDYYRDLSRQLWDEARHAMMGELGFVATGIDWRQIPFTFNWSLGLNTRLAPLERHAVLYFIEHGLMPNKQGKKAEWEVAVASSCPLAQLIQDYDWADEVLHARIGREWLVQELGTQQLALELGDKSWDRILVDWEKLKDDGLTGHRNWWPEIYEQACRHWAVEPEPEIRAYSTSYAGKRPDHKQLAEAPL